MSAPAATILARLEGLSGLALRRGEPLARRTTFRIGGPAELYAEVETEEALAALLREARAAECPFFLLGLGSNVLFPDEGLPGITARLTGEFLTLHIEGTRVDCGGALPLARLARQTAERGLVGLEALSGFPSTVGGAVYMNAGCYGVEIKDLLVAAAVVEADGRRRELPVAELGAGYRSTRLQGSGAVVTRARLELARGDGAAALARIEELNRKRWAALPSGQPHAGSIFKNPAGDYAGRLIEACGLKGARAGGAEISPRHANVIVNAEKARAADVLELMLRARRAVEERFGIALEPEVVLAGALGAHWREALSPRR